MHQDLGLDIHTLAWILTPWCGCGFQSLKIDSHATRFKTVIMLLNLSYCLLMNDALKIRQQTKIYPGKGTNDSRLLLNSKC